MIRAMGDYKLLGPAVGPIDQYRPLEIDGQLRGRLVWQGDNDTQHKLGWWGHFPVMQILFLERHLVGR